MAKRTLEQQIADLKQRQETEQLRVAWRALIGQLKSAAGRRDYALARRLIAQLDKCADELEKRTSTAAKPDPIKPDAIEIPASEGAA